MGYQLQSICLSRRERAYKTHLTPLVNLKHIMHAIIHLYTICKRNI
jgi:hypothetical protein